jgi:hypothetical protein
MNPRLKKWLFRSAAIVVVLFGSLAAVGYLTRDFWFYQLRMYLRGQLEVRLDETGPDLPGVDQVEVIALAPKNLPKEDFTFMPARLSDFIISGRKMLDAKTSTEIARLWRRLDRGRRGHALCRHPGYALRFLSGGQLLFETTVCWECHNYSIELKFPGIEQHGFVDFVDDKDSQTLLALLKAHVPLAAKAEDDAATPQ